jgi:Icc-related predicted phosphoesterase
MPFEINYKKPIPTEKETRANILIIAGSIGCQEQTKNIFKFYDKQLQNEKYDNVAKQKIAENCILELYKLDKRLVYTFLNDNGEIVVGNKILIKIKKDELNHLI